MGNKVGIVIPWFNSGDINRSKAFIYVQNYLRKLDIGRIYVGECNDQPLNRAKMRNNGAWKAIGDGCDILLFNDGDCLLPVSQWVNAIELMQEANGVVIPYNVEPFFTTEDQTEQILAGRDFKDFTHRRNTITPAAGNFGCNIETFKILGGLDEAYRGWGYEDSDFVNSSANFIAGTRVIPGVVVELYHPPTEKKNRTTGPATKRGTDEFAHLQRNKTRYGIKQHLDFDYWKSLHNRELLNIIVPVMRHGVAARFIKHTDFPVIAVVNNDNELADEWRQVGAKVIESPGTTFAQKCNYAYYNTNAEWSLFIGEDVEFIPDWHTPLMKYIPQWGVVGTNDRLYSNSIRSTHLIMSRKYIHNFGGSWDNQDQPFHEYLHNFTDTETITKAQQLGVWKYAHDIVIKHLHPENGRVEEDEVYRLGKQSFEIDRVEYSERVYENTEGKIKKRNR